MNEKLKQLRAKYDLSQKELAALLRLHHPNVSRWESGRVELNWIKFEGIKSILEEKYEN